MNYSIRISQNDSDLIISAKWCQVYIIYEKSIRSITEAFNKLRVTAPDASHRVLPDDVKLVWLFHLGQPKKNRGSARMLDILGGYDKQKKRLTCLLKVINIKHKSWTPNCQRGNKMINIDKHVTKKKWAFHQH